MTLAKPHIGVHLSFVKSVTVSLLLCIKHKSAHTLGREELGGTSRKYTCLKEITGVDVHDDLGSIHKLTLDKSDLGFLILTFSNSGVHNKNLVEGRCSFCYGHRIVAVEGRILINLPIVEGMTKLVSQGNYIRERAVKVSKNSTLSCRVNGTVERAANLALARIEVDPCIVEGFLHHIVKLGVKLCENRKQIIPCLLGGILLIALTHRSKEIVPRKTALVTERLCLCLQVLTESRHILLHCTEKRIKCCLLHCRIVKCLGKRRCVTATSCLTKNLKLNRVKSKSNGCFNLGICLKLCLKSRLSYIEVGIVREISNR